MITVKEITDLEMTVYKKDTKGKIRFLKIFTEGDELSQESGLIDGNPILHTKVHITTVSINLIKSDLSSGSTQLWTCF